MDPLTDEEVRGGADWESRRSGRQYDEADEAVKILERDADLARWIWPLRVIDSDGKVLRVYDPELDTRLPGCRWRIIQRNAYVLWEAAGEPPGDGQNFWLRAEQELKEHNGVFTPKENVV